MSARLHSARGMSLVETTVILMVIAVLAAVIAPSASDYANDARQVAAKKDTANIGNAILQLLKDTGSRCLRDDASVDCTVDNRIDLLISAGQVPESVTAADVTYTDSQAADAAYGTTVNWQPSAEAPGQQDTIDDQLIENDNGTPYPAVTFTGGGGPRMKLGWRGAYLDGPVVGDPWGTRYQVNTMFLTVGTDAVDTFITPDQSQEGLREAGWKRDVLVLSAGVNRIVETSFGGGPTDGVSAVGDDVIFILGGSTR